MLQHLLSCHSNHMPLQHILLYDYLGLHVSCVCYAKSIWPFWKHVVTMVTHVTYFRSFLPHRYFLFYFFTAGSQWHRHPLVRLVQFHPCSPNPNNSADGHRHCVNSALLRFNIWKVPSAMHFMHASTEVSSSNRKYTTYTNVFLWYITYIKFKQFNMFKRILGSCTTFMSH